jgi:murein DD-endopeptidase MepM/ murein hydrolase activator NlpD
MTRYPLRPLIAFTLIMLAIVLTIVLAGAAAAQTPGPGIVVHVVQRGETLYGIAQEYGVSIDELARANAIVNPGSVRVGERLFVPVGPGVMPETHVVGPGESLASIAGLYGLEPDALLALNNLPDPNRLYVGQVLALAMPMGVPLVTDAAAAPVSVSPPAQPASGALTLHTVGRGETVFRIAMQYGVSVSDIVTANSLGAPDLIYAGQQLVIPIDNPTAAALPAAFERVQLQPTVFSEGQTARVRVFSLNPASMTATFLGRGLNVASDSDGRRHTALIAVPLGTAGGIYPLDLAIADAAGTSTLQLNIQVIGGAFRTEAFTLLADRANLLDPAVEGAEMELLTRVMTPFRPTADYTGIFGLPASAPITSPFGAVRSYNGGETTRTHLGTDFAGAPGTPILAPAAGVVVMADTLNVRGVSTILDHGWGVYTGYWHQTERYVSVGDRVAAGQVIGTIGSSGRVSGPHLHWELWVSGTPVDPMQWVLLDFS